MRQNLAFSGEILVILVPLAATGILGLATVVAAHELAEVVVIPNGVRAGGRRLLSRPGEPAAAAASESTTQPLATPKLTNERRTLSSLWAAEMRAPSIPVER